MGRRIIKQPDDRFAVFSTVVDNFVYVNCTEKELIEYLARDAAKHSREDTKRRLEHLDMELHFAETDVEGAWEYHLQEIKDVHGWEGLEELKKDMEDK